MAKNGVLEFAALSDVQYASEQMDRWRAWAENRRRKRAGLPEREVSFSKYRAEERVSGVCSVCGCAVMVRPYTKVVALKEGRGLYCGECRSKKKWRK